jgi:CspA family cold shock protein
MIKGTVKFFNVAKGFGFISPDDGGKDVFLPAATITASGGPRLKPGQRVSFEPEPDVKGPKAVRLTLLEDAPPPSAPPAPPAPAPVARIGVTVYHDPSTRESAVVLEALSAAGYAPRLVDYAAAPPSREDLQKLSLLLRDADQSLVRRYDPLFFELQLDDRFIADSDYWTAVHEHPSLINGPVVAVGGKTRVCRTARDVRALLGLGEPDIAPPQPKAIPARPVAAVPVMPSAPDIAPVAAAKPAPAAAKAEPEASAKTAKPDSKAKPDAKTKKPAAKPKAAAKPKPVAKAKTVAKVPAKKPAAKPKAKAAPAKKKK